MATTDIQPNWYYFDDRWNHVMIQDGVVYLDGAAIGVLAGEFTTLVQG